MVAGVAPSSTGETSVIYCRGDGERAAGGCEWESRRENPAPSREDDGVRALQVVKDAALRMRPIAKCWRRPLPIDVGTSSSAAPPPAHGPACEAMIAEGSEEYDFVRCRLVCSYGRVCMDVQSVDVCTYTFWSMQPSRPRTQHTTQPADEGMEA